MTGSGRAARTEACSEGAAEDAAQEAAAVVREAERGAGYPSKEALLKYLQDVRAETRRRLEATSEDDLAREVVDKDFGTIVVRDVWAGVVTSFAWHAGQIALTAKLLPDSPIEVMEFGYWQKN